MNKRYVESTENKARQQYFNKQTKTKKKDVNKNKRTLLIFSMFY
jgi:hypothetical protein